MSTISTFQDWFREFGQRLGVIAAEVLALVALFVVALLFGWVLRVAFARGLAAVGFDALAERTGATLTARRSGLTRRPSEYVARFFGWLAVLVIVLAGALTMQIPGMEAVVPGLLVFVPSLVTTVIIVVVGALFAEFASRGVLITAVNAGWRGARLVSGVTRLLVMALAAAMALDHLAVARSVVVAAFSIVLGGVVFALALAFGLGGRDLAREYLRRYVAPPPDEPAGMELDHR